MSRFGGFEEGIPLVEDEAPSAAPQPPPTTAVPDASLTMSMSAVADDPQQLCAGLQSEATILRSAEGLLRLYTQLPPLQLARVVTSVRDSGAASQLLGLAASLNPVEEREVAWELLWRIARAASRQPLPTVDVAAFVKTLQTTLRVSNWKYSHDLLCSEATLNAAALRAAEALAAGWPAACPRFVSIVPDIVTMLTNAPAPTVRRACVNLLSTLSCSSDLHEALLKTSAAGALRAVLESDGESLHPLAAAVCLANLLGGSDEPVTTGSGSTDISGIAPLLIERLVGALRVAVRSPSSLHDRRPAQPEEAEDAVSTRALTMALLSLATGESHKRALGDAGLVAQLARCVQQKEEEPLQTIGDGQSPTLSPRPFALRCLLQLSFDTTNRDRMLEDKSLLEFLHAQSAAVTIAHASLRRDALTLLWMLGLRSPAEHTPRDVTKQHVLISYTVKQQHIMLRIKSSLSQAGYNVWAEADGSATTPDELAAAVDNACAVVIGASDAFCQSPLCRLVTERAHSQGREVVPLLTEANYSPAGWLRQLYGGRSVTWFDFGHSTQQEDQLYAAQMSQLEQVLGQRGRRVEAASANSVATAGGFSAFPGHTQASPRHGMDHSDLMLSPVTGGQASQHFSPHVSFNSHQQEYASQHATDSHQQSTASVGFPHGHTTPSDGRWDVAETSAWFRNTLPFASQYQQSFDVLGLDKATLAMMTEQDLAEEIGVSSRLHRRAILTEIQKLQPRPAPKSNAELSPSSRTRLESAMTFDGHFDTFPGQGTPQREAFEDAFKHAMARCFNFASGGDGGTESVHPDDVDITRVVAGSIIVEFRVELSALGSQGAGAAALVQAVKAASSVSGLVVGGYQAKARPLTPFVDIGPPAPGSMDSPRASRTGAVGLVQTPRQEVEQRLKTAATPTAASAQSLEEMGQLHLKLIDAQVAHKAAEAQAITADAEKKRIQDAFDKATQQAAESQLEMSNLKVAVATAEANSQAAERRAETAESKLASVESKLEEATRENGALRAVGSSSDGGAAAAVAAASAAASAAEDSSAELKELRRKMSRAQQDHADEIEQLRDELKAKERALKNAKATAGEAGESDARVDSLEEELAAEKSKAKDLKEEAARLRAKLDEDKDASDSMAAVEEAVAQEREKAAAALEEFKESQSAEVEAQAAEAAAEMVEDLQAQVQEAETRAEEAEARAEEAEAKAEQLEEDLENTKMEMESMEVDLQEAQAELSEMLDGQLEDDDEEELPEEPETPEEPPPDLSAADEGSVAGSVAGSTDGAGKRACCFS
jgi:hypothetical protein